MSDPQRWDHIYHRLQVLYALQRLAELLLSRHNERHSGRPLGSGGRRSYPLMMALHTALFWLPLLERHLIPVAPRRWLIVPGVFGTVLATALRLWVIATLGRGWNVRGVVHEDLRIVDHGPFRYVRHPNYVAVAIELAGLPLAAPAPLSTLLLSIGNVLVLRPRLRGEEELLDRVPGYRERMAGKPRFVPRPSQLSGAIRTTTCLPPHCNCSNCS